MNKTQKHVAWKKIYSIIPVYTSSKLSTIKQYIKDTFAGCKTIKKSKGMIITKVRREGMWLRKDIGGPCWVREREGEYCSIA